VKLSSSTTSARNWTVLEFGLGNKVLTKRSNSIHTEFVSLCY